MSELLVTDLDPSVRDRILERGRRKQHTLEEEVREILRSAAKEVEPATEEADATDTPREGLGTRIANHFRGEAELKEHLARPPWSCPVPPDFGE